MLFSNMNFNVAHFINFDFAHFEIEESFGVNLGKITEWSISRANFHFGYLKGARFKYEFYFCSFCV